MIATVGITIDGLLLSAIETFYNLAPELAKINRIATARSLHTLTKDKERTTKDR